MSILINRNTKVLVQGITGNIGTTQTKLMLKEGTKIVAGVTPGKGGEREKRTGDSSPFLFTIFKTLYL